MTKHLAYCKVYVCSRRYIYVGFYISVGNKIVTQVLFKSTSAQALIKLIICHVFIVSHLSVSHALYIGGELVKAETAIIMRQEYIQN